MEIPSLLLQTAGSLVAILLLAGLAWWLRLGGSPVLADDSALRRTASEVADGFEPVESAISQDHTAALLRDADGQIMVIKRHGNRFAGRILDARSLAHVRGDAVEITTEERRFGVTRLTIRDPGSWAAAINRLSVAHDA